MYRTLGNLSRNPNVGLLFVRFDGKSRRMRINGRAESSTTPRRSAGTYGAQLVVRIECEIYPNCPRYVPDLATAKLSPYVPREGEAPPPPPEWKGRDYIRDILPKGDPHAAIVKAARRELSGRNGRQFNRLVLDRSADIRIRVQRHAGEPCALSRLHCPNCFNGRHEAIALGLQDDRIGLPAEIGEAMPWPPLPAKCPTSSCEACIRTAGEARSGRFGSKAR
jgi:hypothetical protein